MFISLYICFLIAEEVEVSKKWLQSNRQPIVNLLEHWKITRAYRMSVFRTESYEKIFNDWPILNSDLAMRLVSKYNFYDFIILNLFVTISILYLLSD